MQIGRLRQWYRFTDQDKNEVALWLSMIPSRREDATAALEHTNNDGDAALMYAAECMEFGGPAAVAASRWVGSLCTIPDRAVLTDCRRYIRLDQFRNVSLWWCATRCQGQFPPPRAGQARCNRHIIPRRADSIAEQAISSQSASNPSQTFHRFLGWPSADRETDLLHRGCVPLCTSSSKISATVSQERHRARQCRRAGGGAAPRAGGVGERDQGVREARAPERDHQAGRGVRL